MSVLSFPRLYFKGHMGWDPCTANNNDYLPAYATAEAGLDWDYLATQGVTPENFRTTFRPWAMNAHTDACPPSEPGSVTVDNCADNATCHMGSRWDYYGGGGCHFVDYEDAKSLTVGGDLAFDQPAAADDPILGQPVILRGNTFGGRESAARLVDINPSAPWCSQIYFASLQVGDGGTFIGGPRYQRMFSRSFFVPRNISGDLIIAGAIGVVFQTVIQKEELTYSNDGGSALLAQLYDAVRAADAQGLMLRFSAYNTLYYQNGVFNDLPVAQDCDQLSQLYLDGKVFANPAYSRVVGVFGVWGENELASAPQGRFLVPSTTLTPVTPPAAKTAVRSFENMVVAGHDGPNPGPGAPRTTTLAEAGAPALALGVAWAGVDQEARYVALDFSNAIPEFTVEGAKFDYGDLRVGIQLVDFSFVPLGSFGFADYDKAAYEARSGLVDVPFGQGLSSEEEAQLTPENVARWLVEGSLAVQAVAGSKIALLEQALTAETDQRGVYLDQCREQEISVAVRYKGGMPPDGTRVRLAQYYPWPLKVGAGQWQLFGTLPPGVQAGASSPETCDETPDTTYVSFLDGDTVPVVAGTATVRIAPVAPGLPVVAFYPYLHGQATPVLQEQVTFGFTPGVTYSIDNASFAAVRVMAFDNDLVADFVNRWNGTGPYAGDPPYDRLLAWQFVYGKILFLYDMLYPIMDQFVPLGNLTRVEGAIDQIVALVSADLENTSTLYMPVSRELSSGKRIVLETWGNLVIRKYPQESIAVPPVPCD